MSNSTKRALRTVLHVLLAVLLAIPAMVSSLPTWEWLGQIVVVAGALSKVINMAEDSGALPSWLKGDDPTGDKIVAVVDNVVKLGAPDPAP